MTAADANASFLYAGTDAARDLRRRARGLLEIAYPLGDGDSLSLLEEDDLLELLRIGEAAVLGARRALSSKRMLPDRELRPSGVPPGMAEALPVEVSFSEGILTVSCPPTFLRPRKESWALADAVKTALRLHCGNYGVPRIPQPACVLVVRKAAAYRNGYHDNENYESSRIINAVMECLGYTDRPDHLGYVSLFRKVGDPSRSGVDFLFLPLELLKQRPSLLDF